MRTRIALAVALSFVSGVAFAACGGPGYRGPDGRCIGSADLARVCGNPPTQKCTAERPQTKATHGPERESDMRTYRERAMGH